MFRKRTPKEFPPGTFIATPARVLAILQLCLALIVLLWQLSQPFMGDFFAIRSKMALYEFSMGLSEKSAEQGSGLRFAHLPEAQQEMLAKGYTAWQKKLQTPFSTKIVKSIEGLWLLPLFQKVWLILSLVLPVFLLKKVEGAQQAVWLIPLAVVAYALDNNWHGKPSPLSKELQLFPSEEYLLHRYPSGQEANTIFDEKQQLQNSWDLYLIREWAEQEPTPDLFDTQKVQGEYLFTVARALASQPEASEAAPIRQPLSLLMVYLLWNIAFAYSASKAKNKLSEPAIANAA